MLAAAALGVLLQVLVTENSRLVALFQTAALSGTEWRELLFLAAAPLAAHELLAGAQPDLWSAGDGRERTVRIIRAQDPQKDQDQPSGPGQIQRTPGSRSWRLFSRASALFLPRKAPRRTEVKLRNRERKKRTA